MREGGERGEGRRRERRGKEEGEVREGGGKGEGRRTER